MDHERASESGQFSSDGIGQNRHGQVSGRGGIAFYHAGAVREGEAALSAIKLACHALNSNVSHGAGVRGRAGDHFSMADAFEVTVPSLIGCDPSNVVRLLEVGWFGGGHLDVCRTFRMAPVPLLLASASPRATHPSRSAWLSHSHISPARQPT